MYKAVLTLIAALAAGQAVADTRLIMSDGSEDGTSAISVSGDMVAFEEDGRAAMIFDANRDAFTMLNHDQQGYVVMDKAAMKEVRGEMDAMMKQVESQLAGMPPEQREAMMKMMPGMADRLKPKDQPAKANVDFTGKTAKVGGYSCKIARITGALGGPSEVCVAKPKALGISSADFDTMDRAFEMLQQSAAQFGQDAPFPSARDLGGVPIQMTDEDGTVTTLTGVSTDKIDDAMFEIPAGYQRQSIMQ